MTNNRVNLVKPSLTQLDKFKAVTSQMNDTYERKNHDYGDSFHKSIQEFGPMAGIVRINDKFNRLKNLIIYGDQKVTDESVKDTLIDMASYCVMLAIEE